MNVGAGVLGARERTLETSPDTTHANLLDLAELLYSFNIAYNQVVSTDLCAMAYSSRIFVFTFVAAMLLSQCSAHVRMTYPPARQYALDFLDNVRTDPPCGMEAGKHDNLSCTLYNFLFDAWCYSCHPIPEAHSDSRRYPFYLHFAYNR